MYIQWSKYIFPWIREWLPIPGFLSRESHGQRSLVGSMVSQSVDTTEWLTQITVKLSGSGTGNSSEIVLNFVFPPRGKNDTSFRMEETNDFMSEKLKAENLLPSYFGVFPLCINWFLCIF